MQSAATRYRRSQVRIEFSEDEQRVFDAVVKPGQVTQDGNVEREVERLKKEIARSEGMLANERFVGNAPKDVVAAEQAKLERYRSEPLIWPSRRARRSRAGASSQRAETRDRRRATTTARCGASCPSSLPPCRARAAREVAVVAAGDEESRTLQLLHCRERIRAAEGGRRREPTTPLIAGRITGAAATTPVPPMDAPASTILFAPRRRSSAAAAITSRCGSLFVTPVDAP